MISTETIKILKENFGLHGILCRLITNCSSQHTSKEFENFAKSYNVEHVLISPSTPRQKESCVAVKIVKSCGGRTRIRTKLS